MNVDNVVLHCIRKFPPSSHFYMRSAPSCVVGARARLGVAGAACRVGTPPRVGSDGTGRFCRASTACRGTGLGATAGGDSPSTPAAVRARTLGAVLVRLCGASTSNVAPDIDMGLCVVSALSLLLLLPERRSVSKAGGVS